MNNIKKELENSELKSKLMCLLRKQTDFLTEYSQNLNRYTKLLKEYLNKETLNTLPLTIDYIIATINQMNPKKQLEELNEIKNIFLLMDKK